MRSHNPSPRILRFDAGGGGNGGGVAVVDMPISVTQLGRDPPVTPRALTSGSNPDQPMPPRFFRLFAPNRRISIYGIRSGRAVRRPRASIYRALPAARD